MPEFREFKTLLSALGSCELNLHCVMGQTKTMRNNELQSDWKLAEEIWLQSITEIHFSCQMSCQINNVFKDKGQHHLYFTFEQSVIADLQVS